MRGWIVLYTFGESRSILPRHYHTQKNALKFAEEHRACTNRSGVQCEAVVIDVEDIANWINAGKDELERMFRL